MILGIDLGTTNSSLAYVRDGGYEPENIVMRPLDDTPYDALVRSVVYLNEHGRPLAVGDRESKKKAHSEPNGLLLESFKAYINRWSLRKETAVFEETSRSYSLHGEDFRVGGQYVRQFVNGPFSRENIVTASTAVLREMYIKFREAHDRPERLYVGVPFGIWDFGRRRMLQALVEAGILDSYRQAIEKVSFIYEPVAIAHASRFAPGHDFNMMVFDAGGGTLDIAIIRFERLGRVVYEPSTLLALDGTPVAGRHLDKLLSQFLEAKAERFRLAMAEQNPLLRYELMQAVERLKMELSVSSSAWLPPTELLQDRILVTRGDLESAIQPALDKMRQAVKRALNQAGLSPGDVHAVRLAGGTSLIPAVREMLMKIFDERHTEHLGANPEETQRGESVEESLTAVARGLAAFGSRSLMKQHCPVQYSLYDFASEKKIPILQKGTPYDSTGTAQGSPVTVTVKNQSTTLVLLQTYVGVTELVGQVRNVPSTTGALNITCSVHKERGFPTVEVRDSMNRPVDLPQPHLLPESKARLYVGKDDAPLEASGAASYDFPWNRIAVGDSFKMSDGVEWKIRSIRHVSKNASLASVPPWELAHCLMGLQRPGATRNVTLKPQEIRDHEPHPIQTRDIFLEQIESS